MPQEESHMLFLEGQKRELCGTCHTTALVLPAYSQRLRRVCNKSNSIYLNFHSILRPLLVLNQHSCNVGLTLYKCPLILICLDMYIHPGIHMPAVWVQICAPSSPPCYFPAFDSFFAMKGHFVLIIHMARIWVLCICFFILLKYFYFIY